jgi:hypothetical protein
MNVNTTDATTDATALLLPAQNTHTLCVAATPGVFEPVTVCVPAPPVFFSR